MSNENQKKQCPYCGQEISDGAKKCPHCKKWLVEKELPKAAKITLVSLGTILAITIVALCSINTYNHRQAENCFSKSNSEKVMELFKDRAEWKASKEENLYYGGKRKVTMSEPEFRFTEPMSYEKEINKFTCTARVEVKSEESTKYSGESENIERTTTAYDFTYFSYRMPNGKNEIIGKIDNSWTK